LAHCAAVITWQTGPAKPSKQQAPVRGQVSVPQVVFGPFQVPPVEVHWACVVTAQLIELATVLLGPRQQAPRGTQASFAHVELAPSQ
jgi:hypothetical protein